MSTVMHIGVAGAGFSGAVIARELADAGHTVEVFDTRPHVGGNCFTERHGGHGVVVHRYGPHIFHTADERVWAYISQFGEMRPYTHRVKTTVGGAVYSLPINLHTINQVFGTTMSPSEAEAFVRDELAEPIDEPADFEQQALSMVGRQLYELFFAGYTRKQWGCEPSRLPASILKRLPVRFNYDDSYFNHRYQAIPAHGYTPIVEAMLDHASIRLRLETALSPTDRDWFDHVVWSGPLDAWFDHDLGRLRYRTLDFDEFVIEGDFQGTPVMNYGDADVAHTRITEHQHFAPWEFHDTSVCFREFSREHEPGDIPYYPVRMVDDKALLQRYLTRAEAETGVTFVGRLGTYRYLDMDVTIGEALAAADAIVAAFGAGQAPRSFYVDPR